MEEIEIKAFKIAKEKHSGQIRKIKKNPFLIHPVEVGNILISENAPSNLIAAGFLHDTIEDTKYTLNELEKDFNKEVRELVEFATEDMKKDWKTRKEEMIKNCKTATNNELLLEFADKLSNLESLFFEGEEFGFEIFEKFSGSFEEIKDYYKRMLVIFKTIKPNLINLRKYEFFYNELFEKNNLKI